MGYDEAWKYELCYGSESYKMGANRLNYVTEDIMTFESGRTYLDVGCGRGETLVIAKRRGLAAYGIEQVPELCDGESILDGDACNIPFPDDHFDYVSCYDVLEHLPRGDEVIALDELKRVCRGVVLISTNDKPSFLTHPEHGKIDLHINKRPQTDWHAKVIERWPLAQFTERGPHKDWHWRCPL